MKALAFLPCIVLLTVCGPEPHTKTPEKHLSSLPPAGTEVYPLANGAALAVAPDGEGATIFLLSGNEAVRIVGAPPSSGMPDVYPLANGSAYLVFIGTTGFGIFHLDGQSLTVVRETQQLTAQRAPATATGFVWAARIAEQTRIARQDRERREDEADSAVADRQ